LTEICKIFRIKTFLGFFLNKETKVIFLIIL
jgi:uncharacterized membrane protein